MVVVAVVIVFCLFMYSLVEEFFPGVGGGGGDGVYRFVCLRHAFCSNSSRACLCIR